MSMVPKIKFGVLIGGLLTVVACAPTQKPVPPKAIVIAPKVMPASKPKPVFVPCEITNSCAAPKPPAPYNVMGAVLGDACPKAKSPLVNYATCFKGQITAINIAIPALDADAKTRIFDRALEKYGTPYEDRHGGVPMKTKVTMPDWAADKTPPQLTETRGKRYIFWWIDEVAKHYLTVSEGDDTVEVALHRLDKQARRRANNLKMKADSLAEKGKQLTEAF